MAGSSHLELRPDSQPPRFNHCPQLPPPPYGTKMGTAGFTQRWGFRAGGRHGGWMQAAGITGEKGLALRTASL